MVNWNSGSHSLDHGDQNTSQIGQLVCTNEVEGTLNQCWIWRSGLMRTSGHHVNIKLWSMGVLEAICLLFWRLLGQKHILRSEVLKQPPEAQMRFPPDGQLHFCHRNCCLMILLAWWVNNGDALLLLMGDDSHGALKTHTNPAFIVLSSKYSNLIWSG